MAKLTSFQLESYPSVTDCIPAQHKIINDFAICNITIKDNWRKFYILSNLLKTEEWLPFASSLELTEKVDTVATIVTHLRSFVARLRRARGLAPDVAQLITKKGRG
jgi:hypothetical protein